MSAILASAKGPWEAARLHSSLGTREREWIVQRPVSNGEYRILRSGGTRAHGNRVRRFGTQAAAQAAADLENAKLRRCTP